MTSAQVIDTVGRVIWGEGFYAAMADHLKIKTSTVHDWASGHSKVIPAGVWLELYTLLDEEIARIQRAKLSVLAIHPMKAEA